MFTKHSFVWWSYSCTFYHCVFKENGGCDRVTTTIVLILRKRQNLEILFIKHMNHNLSEAMHLKWGTSPFCCQKWVGWHHVILKERYDRDPSFCDRNGEIHYTGHIKLVVYNSVILTQKWGVSRIKHSCAIVMAILALAMFYKSW